MKWYNKFTVINNEHLLSYLNINEIALFARLVNKINRSHKINRGYNEQCDDPNKYIVVNQDENYADAVKLIVSLGEQIKEQKQQRGLRKSDEEPSKELSL